jgi:hypothetical protein
MSDKSERSQHTEARGNRTGATLPECCGPMVERMFKAFSEARDDSSSGSPAENSGTDTTASCASAMRRMAASCCDHRSTEEAADK